MQLEEILLQADVRVHERGRELFQTGAVERGERSEVTVTARVKGSASYPYRVSINLEADSWNCTCPYDLGAVCKHVYAVVLAALETPERFTARRTTNSPALRLMLEQLPQLEESELWTLLEALEQHDQETLAEYAANLERRERDW